MKHAVYKYPLPRGAHESLPVSLPSGAQVLHVGMQHGDICIWARVTPWADPVLRTFIVVGTGWEVEPDWLHLGTVMDGDFVWHVFEEVSS